MKYIVNFFAEPIIDYSKLIKNQAMVEVSASDTYGKNVKRKKKKYLTI
jgi:hypothetical protein